MARSKQRLSSSPVLPFLCADLTRCAYNPLGAGTAARVAAVDARRCERPAPPPHALPLLRRLSSGEAAPHAPRARAEAAVRARGADADEARAAGQALRAPPAAGDRALHRA